METFYYAHEAAFRWLLAAWVIFLIVGACFVLGRSPRAGRARVIIPSVVGFGLAASLLHELMFGEGLRGLPFVAIAASIGGIFWGCVIAGLVSLARRAARVTNP
jgi:hypothetical protein